ncbi:MAG: hypothetical protein H7196_03220 [candidate division SR1 bacterium]|nr:hypothetical protein [candidate division SR1 bacterium]
MNERNYDILIGYNINYGAVQTNPDLTTITVPAQHYKYDIASEEMHMALINKGKEY